MERNKISEIQKKYEEAVKMITKVGENTKYVNKEKEIQKVTSEIQEIESIKNRLEELKKRIATMPEEVANKAQYEEQCEKQLVNVEKGLQDKMDLLKRLKEEKDTIEKQKAREEERKRVKMLDDIRRLREKTKNEVAKQRNQIEGAMQKNRQNQASLAQKVMDVQRPEIREMLTKQQFDKLKAEYEKLSTEKEKLEKMLSMCDEYIKELDSDYYEMPEQLPADKMYIDYRKEQEKEEQPDKSDIEGKEKINSNGKHILKMEVSGNQINDNGIKGNVSYKAEKERGHQLKEKYDIETLFHKDRKHSKNIDWALVSKLDKIDPTGNLIMDYFSVIKNEPLNGKSVEESRHNLKTDVDIEYKFYEKDKSLSALNFKDRRRARVAYKLGIADLSGISRESLLKKVMNGIKSAKSLFKRNKTSVKKSSKVKDRMEERRKAMKGYIVTDEKNYLQKRARDLNRREQQEMLNSQTIKPDSVVGEDGEEIII